MRKPIQTIKERLADEIGSHFQHGPKRVAMLYPSPYRAGMSSLGYQWTIEILAKAGFSVERVFLPDNVDEWKKSGGVLCSYETRTPLSHFQVIGISLAYELEMAGLIQCLELAGIPPLRTDRSSQDPILILGGAHYIFQPPSVFSICQCDATWRSRRDNRSCLLCCLRQ